MELDQGYPLILSANDITALGLFQGQELEPPELSEAINYGHQSKALASSLRLLSYRPRSEAEIRRHLKRRGTPEKITAYVIGRLQELGYLDDLTFAVSWRESRARSAPRGSRILRRELAQKGITNEIAEKVIQEGPSDEEQAWNAIQTRLRKLTGADYVTFRTRLTAFLHYRGFPSSIIRKTIDEAWTHK